MKSSKILTFSALFCTLVACGSKSENVKTTPASPPAQTESEVYGQQVFSILLPIQEEHKAIVSELVLECACSLKYREDKSDKDFSFQTVNPSTTTKVKKFLTDSQAILIKLDDQLSKSDLVKEMKIALQAIKEEVVKEVKAVRNYPNS